MLTPIAEQVERADPSGHRREPEPAKDPRSGDDVLGCVIIVLYRLGHEYRRLRVYSPRMEDREKRPTQDVDQPVQGAKKGRSGPNQ